jgi:predicted dehydrogenase
MNPMVKIGVVGASWFSDLWYLPVLEKHPNVILQAICSKNGDSAKRMAEKYRIQKVYSSYQSMVAREELDGICIVTPNDTHKAITLMAIEKGLHVMCEKPLAIDSKEAFEMFSSASKKNIVHAVNFTYRENPGIQMIKEMVRNGKLGKTLEGDFEYTGDYGLNGSPGWRGNRSEAGIGGILQDLGSHLIDLAQETVGEKIIEVMGMSTFLESGPPKKLVEFPESNQAADSVRFLANFASGFQATFRTSWISIQGNKGQTIEIKINGTEGSIQFVATELGTSLYFAKKGEQWQQITLEDSTSFNLNTKPNEENFRPWRLSSKNEVWKWIDNMIGDHQAAIASFEDGYYVQKVIDSVMESAQQGKRMRMDEN